MSNRTKCPECNGTGEVESFWTTTPPTEPGFYWVQFIDRGMEIVKAVNIAGGIYWWIAEQPATTDLLPWQKQIEYWSREPIQFPDAPKGE